MSGKLFFFFFQLPAACQVSVWKMLIAQVMLADHLSNSKSCVCFVLLCASGLCWGGQPIICFLVSNARPPTGVNNLWPNCAFISRSCNLLPSVMVRQRAHHRLVLQSHWCKWPEALLAHQQPTQVAVEQLVVGQVVGGSPRLQQSRLGDG